MPTWRSERGTAGILVAAGSAVLAAGCQHDSRTYDGHTRDEVWTAMVSAAREPRYRDWIVVDNQVWVDEPGARVEILRELKRDVVLPAQKPFREECEWRLRGTIEPGDPPTLVLTTHDLCIPAHFWLQADHFFDQVQHRLATAPPPAPLPPGPRDDPMLLPPPSVAAPAGAEPLDGIPATPPPVVRPGTSQPVDVTGTGAPRPSGSPPAAPGNVPGTQPPPAPPAPVPPAPPVPPEPPSNPPPAGGGSKPIDIP